MPDPTPEDLPEQYHLLMPTWGEKYIQVFLRFTLPSHMSDGNIDALPRDRTALIIYTRSQDVPVFRASPLFRRYERDHAVRFEFIDDLKLVKENPYQTLVACHERALAAAAGTDTALFFLNPDAVYCDGTYRAILDRFREGKRAILTQGLRANLPAFAERLDALRAAPDTWPGLSPRQLTRLTLDALHPLSVAHVVDGGGNKSIGSYYWPVGTDGLVGRCFHTHPLALRPARPVTKLYTTIDHELVRWACPDPKWVHLVTDSDEIIAVELSDPSHLADWVKTENVPAEELMGWMQEWTNAYHRSAFCRSIVFHAGPVTGEYAAVEREAERFASAVLAEFTRRTPQARPDMEIVLRAVEHDRYTAEVARQAEARQAEEARRAEEQARAEHAARPAEATPAAVVRPAPPVPVPPKPSILGRLFTKGHRLLNRPLYDRGDNLVNAVKTLSEQRQIHDARLQSLEAHGSDLARRVQAEAAHRAELARQAEATQKQSAEASQTLRQELAATQQEHAATQQGLAAIRHEQATLRQGLTAAQQELAATQARLAEARQELAAATLAVANTVTGVKYTHDRLLQLLSLTGQISFSDRDPARPSSQPPLGYSHYDMASIVYRPAFERAIRYLQGNDLTGCVAEFGTYRGFTAQTFAELLRDINWPADLYLYDSFAGLPAPTGNDASSYEVVRRQAWVEGAMTPEADIVAQIRKSVVEAIGAERLYIHPGYFDASLPAHPPREPVAILHIDADLYSSARFVLQHLSDARLIRDGAVLLMDDYNCNAANPDMGERKALTDFVADNPRWSASPWFAYGWHGHAFFLHDRDAAGR